MPGLLFLPLPSVGPAVLNGHAANYRRAVTAIPAEMLLVETDRTAENAAECPSVAEVLREVAALRGVSLAEIEAITDANADKLLSFRRWTASGENGIISS